MLQKETLYGAETLLVEKRHAVAPGGDAFLNRHQGKGNPLDVTVLDVGSVLDRQGARSQVARIGIVLAAFHEETLEVIVADNGLAANDKVSLIADALRNPTDGSSQVGDIRSDMTIAASDNLRQATAIVGNDKRQAIQLPRNPDGALFGPLDQVFRFLGLGQREGGKLMFLLLSGNAVLRDTLCGRVGQGSGGLLLQTFQFIETGIPLVVRHLLRLTVVVGVGGLVQLPNELLHSQYLVVSHKHHFTIFMAKLRKIFGNWKIIAYFCM